MKKLIPLLYPFAVLYGLITRLRNRLYDTGIRPSAKFEVPVISVGNLSAGGTGKTPMIEYLIRLLASDYKVATLSRGYGRKTRGIRIAHDGDNATTIGDEPLQLYKKFNDRAVIAVGEERAYAIPYILHERSQINLILLDDAFQHRKVQPSFQILLTDFSNLFFNDFLLPAGRLREPRSGAQRANAIVVTKCPPHVTEDQMMAIEKSIRRYNNKAVFFATLSYGNILPMDEVCIAKPGKVILVSGIANPASLEAYMRQNFQVVKHFSFRDHHPYSHRDFTRICDRARQEQAAVVTTEKDAVKMNLEVFRAASVSLNYLPIEMQFLKSGKEFDEMILNAPEKYGS